jgi:hypothetical protein
MSSPSILHFIQKCLSDPDHFIRVFPIRQLEEMGFLASEVQRIVNRGFDRHGLDKERFTLLVTILQRHADRPGISVADKAALASIIFGDILKYNSRLFAGQRLPVNDLRTLVKSGSAPNQVGDFDIYVTPFFDEHFWKNLSIGLARDSRIFLRAYAANNHLMMNILDNPADFIQDLLPRLSNLDLAQNLELTLGLENLSFMSTKIDDSSIFARVPKLQWNTIDGRKIDLLDDFIFRVSYDSKVYINPNRIIDAHVLQQQMDLLFGDRIRDNIVPLLRKLDDPALALSDIDKIDIIEHYVPAIFLHYIYMPKDVAVSATTHIKYAEAIQDLTKYRLEPMIPDDLQGTLRLHWFMDALSHHVSTHFSSGRYINQNSNMRYFDF